jgi:hypothetical protein
MFWLSSEYNLANSLTNATDEKIFAPGISTGMKGMQMLSK